MDLIPGYVALESFTSSCPQSLSSEGEGGEADVPF